MRTTTRRNLPQPRISLRMGVVLLAVIAMTAFVVFKLLTPDQNEIQAAPKGGQQGPVEPVPRAATDAEAGENKEPGHAASAATIPPGGELTAHVIGAVKKPGIVVLAEGSRIFEAVEQAGGLTKNAAADSVNLAQKLEDGAQIRILTKAEAKNAPPAAAPPQPGSGTAGGPRSSDVSAPSSNPAGPKVNVNTADAATLEQLPGVGPATAAKILSHREKFGPFATPEDLTAVKGIGPATVEKFRDQLEF